MGGGRVQEGGQWAQAWSGVMDVPQLGHCMHMWQTEDRRRMCC